MSAPEVVILRELLAAGGAAVSGSKLAEGLGVSRVAVWGHMEKLRAAGFVFDAMRRRGYRLLRAPARIHPWMVQAHLGARWRHPFVWHEELDSTNTEAERHLAAGLAAPFVVMAARQTAGRGRFGRPWSSVEGGIHMSVGFRPRIEPARLSRFTLWMGVCLCGTVANTCGLPVQVKWPNDLFLGERKVGGMLTEARVDGDLTRDLIFGLGLNACPDTKAWPEEVRRRATSLASEAKSAIDIHHMAASVLGRVLSAYHEFVEGTGMDERLRQSWETYDALRGREVCVRTSGREVRGRAEGIDAEGSLRVKIGPGRVQKFSAGEVSLSPA